MVNRRLGILFLVAVLLSFLTGYFAKEIMPAFFSGEPSESFDFVTDFLEDNYYYELDENAIDQAYIDSLYRIVESYGNQNNDPYTRLFAFPQIDDVRFDEFYIGMGIEIQIEEDQIRITAVNKDSDAFGKLMPNDLIIGVVIEDQEIMFDALESDENMILYLSVKDEVQKTLIIQTPDLDVFHETIFVKTISTPSIESKALGEEDIAYIKINQFHAFMHETLSPGTSFLFKQALNILESEMLLDNPESKTLIIDLRDNPGGALTALHNAFSSDVHIPGIIQELLPRSLEKPIFSMIPRNTELARDFNNTRLEKKPYDIKILVNENSASASEVLAATLYTNGNYTVYGKPTFGKNVYQNSVSLFTYKGVEYGLTYTEGMWFYDGDKNVLDHPIPVQEINQEGIMLLGTPYYPGHLSLDSVALELSVYQAFLNIYYEEIIVEPLREDGYFDQATQDMIEMFQAEKNLPVTGSLDRDTAMKIYETIIELKHNVDYDAQLQELLQIIKNT